jgi:peptidoglycan hydrolase CwlO-like protein
LNKKRLVLLGFIVFIVLAIVVSTCSGCTGSTQPTTSAGTPLEQLTARVSTAESDIDALQVAVANVSVPTSLTSQVSSLVTDVATLKAQVAVLQAGGGAYLDQSDLDGVNADLNALEGRVAVGEADIDALQTNLDALSANLSDIEGQIDALVITDYSGDIEALEAGLAGLTGSVGTLSGRLDALQADITELEGSIGAINGRLDDIDADLDLIAVWWDEWSNIPSAEIVRDNFNSSATSKWVEIKVSSTFSSPIILTIWGSSVGDTDPTPADNGIHISHIWQGSNDLLDDVQLTYYDYGGAYTQRVVVMKITSDDVSWQDGKTYRLIVDSYANIEFMEVNVGYGGY